MNIKQKWLNDKLAQINNELQNLQNRLQQMQQAERQTAAQILVKQGALQAIEEVVAEVKKKKE